YEIDRAFGLMVEVLAVTGARISQAARLTCADLQVDRPDPRLMMPSSFKGHGEKQITHRPVPITQELAAALESARGDRPDDAPLLLKQDGTRWQEVYTSDHRTLFRRTIERAELDPNEVTSYALRHSSIVRCLLGHVPSMVTAMQHDTSEAAVGIQVIQSLRYVTHALSNGKHSRQGVAAPRAARSFRSPPENKAVSTSIIQRGSGQRLNTLPLAP